MHLFVRGGVYSCLRYLQCHHSGWFTSRGPLLLPVLAFGIPGLKQSSETLVGTLVSFGRAVAARCLGERMRARWTGATTP